MSVEGAALPPSGAIGSIDVAPFVRLPDPGELFAARARRFGELAATSDLAPYLRFLAGLAAAQHAVQDGLPAPDRPDPDDVARARAYAMPPLDRGRFLPDAAFEATVDRLLALCEAIEMPVAAAAVLARAAAAGPAERRAMIAAVLADRIPVEALAEHAFVAAALQVHFARLAAGLDEHALVPVGDGACPACGGPPVSSLVIGGRRAEGARYCACSLCATQWNYVRIKCTLCGTTENIGYQEIEGGPGTVKAETCEACRAYVKVLYQNKDPSLDPVADDVASLGLDLLMAEGEYRRGGVDPFLLGY